MSLSHNQKGVLGRLKQRDSMADVPDLTPDQALDYLRYIVGTKKMPTDDRDIKQRRTAYKNALRIWLVNNPDIYEGAFRKQVQQIKGSK